MPSNVDRYWKQYLRSLPWGVKRPARYTQAGYFGIVPEDAPAISALVLNGTKTASGSLLWTYEAERTRPPQPGDLGVITNGHDDPVCILETTEVQVIPFDEVGEDFARDGGEDDRTLASWRRIYWDFIVSECAEIGREPSEKAPLVMERFRVVYREPLRKR
ncbi:MAG: ASCH domain-containing protein [Thermoplasmata archaeon]